MDGVCDYCGHDDDGTPPRCGHCRCGRPDGSELSFAKLVAALHAEPHEAGMQHPIEGAIRLALEANPERTLVGLLRFCTSPLKPVAGAAILDMVAHIAPAPGGPAWRMQLVRSGLAHQNVAVRDAAMALMDARPEWEHCLPALLDHRENVPYLAEYRRGILAEHNMGDRES